MQTDKRLAIAEEKIKYVIEMIKKQGVDRHGSECSKSVRCAGHSILPDKRSYRKILIANHPHNAKSLNFFFLEVKRKKWKSEFWELVFSGMISIFLTIYIRSLSRRGPR